MTILALVILLWLQTSPSVVPEAAMSGRIRLPDGRPASNIHVFALSADSAEVPNPQLRLDGVAQTDKAGKFQFKNLPAGRHYIAAGLLEALTYFPGVTKLTDARVLSPAGNVGGELDFALDPSTSDLLTEVKEIPPNPLAIASTGKKVDATTKLEVRQTLQVEAGKEWWGARILELLPDGRVRIHYLGWSTSFDEVVPRARLQLDAKAFEKTKKSKSLSKF